jgi:hypothetical protein
MTYRNNLSPNDTELSIKLRDTGDAAAFEALYTRHAALISSFLFRLAGEKGLTLLPKLIDRLRDRSYAIRDVENFHLWALGVASSFWREETKDDEYPKESDPVAFQVIHRLAHYLRPVFILVHYFQLPLDDVASALRISRGTATSRLQDAFASLVAQVAPAEPPPPIEEDLSVEVISIEVATPPTKPLPALEEPPKEAAPSEEKPPVPSEAKSDSPVLAEATDGKAATPEAKAPPEEAKPSLGEKPATPPPVPPPVPPLPPAVPPPVPLLVSPLSAPPASESGSSLAALIPKLSFDAPESKEPEKKS